MKTKHNQLYLNECGKYSILNLFYFYKIKDKNIDINYSISGTSLIEMENVLKEHFYEVKTISFNINELKKVKHFSPFIALLSNKGVSHYVVVYKKTDKYIFIMDSLKRNTYKLTYDQYDQIDLKKALVVDNKKKVDYSIKSYFYLFINTIFSLIESLFFLSTTILIQQVIDNGFKDAVFYLIIQVILLLIFLIKMKMFLDAYKKLDSTLICPTLDSIFNLKRKYIKCHEVNELFYRINDAYSYKQMILTFFFNMQGDITLFLLSIILVFFYSYIVGIIFLLLSIIAFVFSYFILRKTTVIVEEKRSKEYEFINSYKDNLKKNCNKRNVNLLSRSKEHLIEYQKLDYSYEKITNIKNMILLFFQSFIVTSIVFIYFTKLYEYLSIGSLVALINLVSLTITPALNICQEVQVFANQKLVISRLEELNRNV